MNIIEKAVDNADAVATAAHRVTVGAGVGTVGAGLTWNEWGVIAGIALGVLSYITSTVFRYIEFRARMRRLEQGLKTDTGLQDL